MDDTRQARLLASWLAEREGGEARPEPPEGLDPEVAEAVLALRPDLAPPPRVGIDDVLAEVREGPFAAAPGDEAQVVPLASRRRAWWRRPAVVALAVAATAMVVVIPGARKLMHARGPFQEAPATAVPGEVRRAPEAVGGLGTRGRAAGATAPRASRAAAVPAESAVASAARAEPAPAAPTVASGARAEAPREKRKVEADAGSAPLQAAADLAEPGAAGPAAPTAAEATLDDEVAALDEDEAVPTLRGGPKSARRLRSRSAGATASAGSLRDRAAAAAPALDATGRDPAADAVFATADRLLEAGDPDGARAALGTLVEHADPWIAADAAARLARLELRLGLTDAALATVEVGLSRAPAGARPALRVVQGDVLAARGDRDGARTAWKNALLGR